MPDHPLIEQVIAEQALLAAVRRERRANAQLDARCGDNLNDWNQRYQAWRDASKAMLEAGDKWMTACALPVDVPAPWFDRITEPGDYGPEDEDDELGDVSDGPWHAGLMRERY